MAEKAVSGKDVFQQGFLSQANKEAVELAKNTEKLEKALERVAKQQEKILQQSKDPSSAAAIKKRNKALEKSVSTRKQLANVQKVNAKAQKSAKIATTAEIKQKIKLQATNKAIRDSLKDVVALENKNLGTLQRVAIESKKLRRERERLNLETKKGRDRLKDINIQLDKNNKKVQQNSDKLKQQKLNVGNYTESVKDAASQIGFLSPIMQRLNQITAVANAFTKKNTIQEEANTVAKEINATATLQMTAVQRGLNASMAAGTKVLRVFKTALAATGIGALLLAVGGLVAFFTRAQDGADSLSKGMAGIGAAVDVIIDRFSSIGEACSLFFDGDFAKGFEVLKGAFKGIGDEIENDVALATKLKTLTIELTRQQKLFEAQQATTVTRIKELTVVTKNKLAADQDRLKAVREVNDLEIGLTERLLELQEQELAASLDAISADGKSLGLQAEHLDFVERIKNGQIETAEAVKLAADFTLSSAAGEEALFEIVDKVVQLEQERQNLLDKQATTAKRTASIVQQIANKNSTAFLQQAAAQKELAKDADSIIEDRILAFNKARDFETSAFKVRFDANLINYAEYEAARVKFAKIAEENIQKLRDIADAKERKRILQLEKERQEGLKAVETDKINEIKTLETELIKLDNLKNQGVENDQERADKEIEIQKAKLQLILDNEKSTAEDIARARALFDKFEIDQQKKKNDELAADEKKARDKRLDDAKKFTNEVGQELQKRRTAEQQGLDAEIQANSDAIQTQLDLAKDGKANQLTFERAEADKLALEKKQAAAQAQKEQEAIALVEAFFGALKLRQAEVGTTSGQATLKAIADVGQIKLASRVVTQFAKDGNEMVMPSGQGGRVGVDDIPFMLTKQEAVITRDANLSNPGVAKALNDGSFNDMYMPKMNAQNIVIDTTQSTNFAEVLVQNQKQIDLLTSIKNKPTQMLNVNQLNEIIETRVTNGHKKTIVHKPSLLRG